MDRPNDGLIMKIRRLTSNNLPRPFKVDLRSLAELISYTPFSMALFLTGWGGWVCMKWTAFNTPAYRIFLEWIPSEFSWGAFAIFFGSAAAMSMYGFGFNNWVTRTLWVGAGAYWIVLAGQFIIASPGNPATYMYTFPAVAMLASFAVPPEYIRPIRDSRDARTVS